MPRSNPLADALAAIDKIPDRRAREVVLREFYQAYKDDPRLWDDPVKAEPVEPRRLGTVLSVRLSSDLAAELRRRADALGGGCGAATGTGCAGSRWPGTPPSRPGSS